MRELITFAVGQAGNQIASAFWETILKEHGLNHDGVRIPNSLTYTGICRQ